MKFVLILIIALSNSIYADDCWIWAVPPADAFFRNPLTGELEPEFEELGFNVKNCTAPQYPNSLFTDEVEGYVDVEFSFNIDNVGPVVKIINSSGQSAFNEAVLIAMSNWRIAPEYSNLMPVTIKRHRFSFRLED